MIVMTQNLKTQNILDFCFNLCTIFITDLGSGCCPSRAVATIETLINPSKLSSVIAPIINSASGSTSALTLLTASSTSNNFKSYLQLY